MPLNDSNIEFFKQISEYISNFRKSIFFAANVNTQSTDDIVTSSSEICRNLLIDVIAALWQSVLEE